jgi:predicted NUDIX family phosphoesterase
MSASSAPVEHVLCVPTLLFHEIGYFQGFQPMADHYLTTLLDPAHTVYIPRPDAEEDPSYKQLIPYCVFRCQGEIFYYRRGSAGGEGRLHKKRSIGIGGHISSTDQIDADRRYFEAMHREIDEEVFLESEFREKCVGLINDDQTPVGRVHLGIVHIFDLESAKVRPREESILETGFAPPAELVRDRDDFETWSQIVLDEISGTTRSL